MQGSQNPSAGGLAGVVLTLLSCHRPGCAGPVLGLLSFYESPVRAVNLDSLLRLENTVGFSEAHLHRLKQFYTVEHEVWLWARCL